MDEQQNTPLDRLSKAGYKITNARKTILKVLQNSHGHITSATILEQVHELDDSIGRASVFRTLDLLTQLGIIRPTYIDTSMTPHYVLMQDDHHHHIICTNCHRTIEVHDCGLGAIEKQLEERFNVQITGHLVEFYGLCADCQQDSA